MMSSGHSPFSDAGAKSMKLRHLSPTAEKRHAVMINTLCWIEYVEEDMRDKVRGERFRINKQNWINKYALSAELIRASVQVLICV